MANPQFLRFRLLTVTLLSVAALAIAPVAANASVKNPSTTSVLAAAHLAVANVNGVHIVVSSHAGKIASSVVVDIGKTSGTETITSGTESITILVTPTYAYLRGSATGLTKIMGLTAAQQKIVGTKSLSMKAGTTPYINFKNNLTTPALSAMLPAVIGTTYSSTTHNKVKSYVLTWTTKATTTTLKTVSVLTFPSSGPTLPMTETITSKTGGGTTTFSKWGESPNVTAPSALSTVPYTALFG